HYLLEQIHCPYPVYYISSVKHFLSCFSHLFILCIWPLYSMQELVEDKNPAHKEIIGYCYLAEWNSLNICLSCLHQRVGLDTALHCLPNQSVNPYLPLR